MPSVTDRSRYPFVMENKVLENNRNQAYILRNETKQILTWNIYLSVHFIKGHIRNQNLDS